ncbi:hypothetical protein [Sorangium sp. So ce887]|uniref:hypothetical protein n=1 Tax=Sorangium sp. So ce887 TaxID=3133324 RepID=UPI003F62A72F
MRMILDPPPGVPRATLDGLSLDTGVVVISDRRPGADPESGTRFVEVLTPSGRRVTALRA